MAKSRSTNAPNSNVVEARAIKQIPSGSRSLKNAASQTVPETETRGSPQALKNEHTNVDEVVGGIEGLDLVKKQNNRSSDIERDAGPNTDSTEDMRSHLSNSSVKPPSFDNKSMMSVTTFAMDEKESLRPDDSASMQAAEEDEPYFPTIPGRFRVLAESDMSISQPRGQFRDNGMGVLVPAAQFMRTPLVNPPRFGNMPLDEQHSDAESPPSDALGETNLVQIVPTAKISPTPVPDEKLIEALAAPTDRMPLLRWEHILLAFIQDNKQEYMDLTASNSFGRLLAHKLADYYGLDHSVTADNCAVRIYHQQLAFFPIALLEIATKIPMKNTISTSAAAFKIMRRDGMGKSLATTSTTVSSSGPSKATSETGGSDEGILSPAEFSQKDRSKMTLEERQAAYDETRKRIFKDFPEPTTIEGSSVGNSIPVSRSSSSSGKQKSRRKTPKDDSFDDRTKYKPGVPISSSGEGVYNAPFGNMPFAMPLPTSPAASPQNGMYGMVPTQPYSFESMLAASQNLTYPPHQHGSSELWTIPQSPQSTYSTFYGSYGTQATPQMVSPYQPNTMQTQSTTNLPSPYPMGSPPIHQGFQPHYLQSSPIQTPLQSPPVHWPNYPPIAAQTPYQYGQLPPQYASSMLSNQHPIPGSYNPNRSIFNPQTQSFVPAGQATRAGRRSNKQNSSATPSNNDSVASQSPKPNIRGGSSTTSLQQESLQKKWGTPAHLPKKPPPSQVPSSFDVDSTLS